MLPRSHNNCAEKRYVTTQPSVQRSQAATYSRRHHMCAVYHWTRGKPRCHWEIYWVWASVIRDSTRSSNESCGVTDGLVRRWNIHIGLSLRPSNRKQWRYCHEPTQLDSYAFYSNTKFMCERNSLLLIGFWLFSNWLNMVEPWQLAQAAIMYEYLHRKHVLCRPNKSDQLTETNEYIIID